MAKKTNNQIRSTGKVRRTRSFRRYRSQDVFRNKKDLHTLTREWCDRVEKRKKAFDNLRVKELQAELGDIIGFGNVKDKGYSMNEGEVNIVTEYCTLLGGNPDYVRNLLEKRGRPFDVYDAQFTGRCLLCHDIRNYCAC